LCGPLNIDIEKSRENSLNGKSAKMSKKILQSFDLVVGRQQSPVYSDTTQFNSTQLPVVDPPTARWLF